jgi:hypothetical protein
MGSDSSQGWDKLGEVVNVESMITFAMGGIATQIIQHHTPPCDTDLEWCKKELEGIKTRINELSPDRRERMRIAARQGKCVSLETLESRLLRYTSLRVNIEPWFTTLTFSLLDERCGLAARAAGSNFFQRYLPAALSQLRTDIGVLKDAVSQLWEDTSVCIQHTDSMIVQMLTSFARTPQLFT